MSKLIPLTNGEFTLVDDEDYEELAKYKWGVLKVHQSSHATRTTKTKNESRFMHRIIFKAKTGEPFIDHIDGNGLNNQKSNLRWASRSENMQNSKKTLGKRHSKYKGVSFHKGSKKWCANIRKETKKIYLGLFETEIAAAQCYNKVAKEIFGAFAKINLIEGE